MAKADDMDFLQDAGDDFLEDAPSDREVRPLRAEPLNASERLKLVLLFDDPKRREAYLDKIGFEMDPKDINKIRPIGSSEAFNTEIDPGGLSNLKQYYANPKGLKGGLNELALDTVEALDSFFQGAAEEAVGAGAGLLAAGATTVPTAGAATVPAFMGGRAIGRATANLILSNLKEDIGDLFLDKEVPVEMEDKLFQAAISSVAPEVISGVSKPVIGAAKKSLQGLRGGFRYLMNLGGGNVSDEAMEALAKDPKTFGNIDNLKQAPAKIMELMSASTGLGPEDGIPRKFRDLGDGSLFKQKMSEAEQLRRGTVNQLATDSNASTNSSFIIDMLNRAKEKLTSDKVIKSKNTMSAAAELDNYINMVKQAAGHTPGDKSLSGGVINFKQLDNMIKEIQDDAFGSEGEAKNALRSLSHDINSYAKGLANKVSQNTGLDISDYVSSKGQEAKIYDAFELFAKNVTPQKAMTRVIGKGVKGATGRGTDFTDKALTETFAKMDDALGTNISEGLQTGQLQGEILRAIESGKLSRGAGGFMTGAAAAGIPAAMASGGNPVVTGLAALGGGLAASPNVALPSISGLTRGMNNLDSLSSSIGRFQQGGTDADLLRAAIQGSNIEQPAIQSVLDRFQSSQPSDEEFLE